MKVAVLTGGGDCPGLNAVIRAVVRRASAHGFEMMGLRDGWKGLLDDNHFRLTRETTSGILHRGGTILGTSRVNPFKVENGLERVKRAIERNGIHAVIAIGGEGTLSAATRMSQEGVKIVGVPKTIDNDLNGTDFTFGFDTAVQIATEAGDRLRTTGDSHMRCMVLEVMGRHVGWIALHAGMAVGAHAILIPEQPRSIDEICDWAQQVYDRRRAPLIVVSEGFRLEGMEEAHSHKGLDAFNRPRLGGISELITPEIEARTGIESRSTVLGHIQRGGAPTGADRVLATRFGLAAIEAVHDQAWGQMVSLRGTDIVRVPFADALSGLKVVPEQRYHEAELLFG